MQAGFVPDRAESINDVQNYKYGRIYVPRYSKYSK